MTTNKVRTKIQTNGKTANIQLYDIDWYISTYKCYIYINYISADILNIMYRSIG
jgi:hypothetical protein